MTDSNGWIAFQEPGWEGVRIYFHVRSHGYDYPEDKFGNRGKAFTIRAGQRARIEINRVNIAERLYRLTGEGIYRDSALLDQPMPLQKPTMNARVFGQVFGAPNI